MAADQLALGDTGKSRACLIADELLREAGGVLLYVQHHARLELQPHRQGLLPNLQQAGASAPALQALILCQPW